MSVVVHKSVLPPTGADECVSCFFTHGPQNFGAACNTDDDFRERTTMDENVVVASGNRLTIYAVARGKRRHEEEEEEEEEEEKNKENVRLEVVSEFDVNGTISDLCVLKHPKRFALSEETNANVLRESSSSKKNAGISGRDGRNNNSTQQQNVEYLDGLLVTIRESKAVCVCWDPETR